jgi:DNA polymerase-3 subunit gamma/tau
MAKRKSATAEPEVLPGDGPTKALRGDRPVAGSGKDYTVLARRYRPQQFRDLVGQEAVAQALANAIESGRVAHAYLFTGARGVGKTSAARILAKALNCVKGPTAIPCGECELCRAIASGEDVDVLEIDGASNRGIDEVREIRQNVQFRPARAHYKIYIIDEVHMLTTQAFNALLKTLEEPPAHVKFIFATTDAQKIPITILSRCQRFDFAGIGTLRIVERLRDIVGGEMMQADDDALQLVARRAGGSMRDAQSLLDQLLAFSGERLTTATVHQLLGTANEERVASIATAILAKDAKLAVAIVGELVEQGQQLGELFDQLIEYWRDLMVVCCAGAEDQELSVTGTNRDALGQQAKGLSLDTILAGLDVLVNAKSRLRTTSHTRVILEIALVRLVQMENLVPLSQLVQWVANNGTATGPPGAYPLTASGQTATSARTPPPSPTAEKKKLDPELTNGTLATILPLTAENVQAIWQQVLAGAGFAVANDLRKVQSAAISGPNALVIRVPERYNSSGPGTDPSRWTRIEPLLTRVVGQPCTVQVEWVKGEAADGQGQPGVSVAPGPLPPGARQIRDKVRQMPQVQKARDVLGAEILSVDPDFGEALTAPPTDDEPAETSGEE